MTLPAPPPVAARPFDRESFWTVAVGLPALVSVLRLWAEAGGDLETTLLLVANVGPVNLFAGLVVTATWLVSAALVAIFAIGSLTHAALPPTATRLSWTSLFAQLAVAAPSWLRIIAFVLAALTWQLLYLPLLILAACAAFGQYPDRNRGRPTGWIVAGVGYLVLLGPVAVRAALGGYLVPLAYLVLPPVLLALGAARPVPASLARPFAAIAQGSTLTLVLLAVTPLLTTPVLPRGVIIVTGSDGAPAQPVRGHVIEVNDATTAVLRARGGVEFIPNDRIADRILCPDEGEAARYRLWVFGLHIEDSILQGVGRFHRPAVPLDPRCRPTVPERQPGAGFSPVEPTTPPSTTPPSTTSR
ncbi:hypothetical protein V6U90_19020 [Micromonospora sp. CPCC 206060]|uniref:hypothetical protein n=1 Tax=Micromonospora sp. CPCC 206060 TaxID=3122406 RepID=UPI002FF1FE33